MAVHLLGLLERASATSVQAMAAAALVAPVQVAARLVEFFLLRSPIRSRPHGWKHPIGANGRAPPRLCLASFAALRVFRASRQQYGDI